jgi:hypothetical protein
LPNFAVLEAKEASTGCYPELYCPLTLEHIIIFLPIQYSKEKVVQNLNKTATGEREV